MLALLVLALLQEPEPEPVRLPPPASVTLDRGERSVGDLLKALRDQTRVKISAKDLDETRNVTIGWKEAPVLRALDELCQALGAGDLQISQEEVVIDGSSARPKGVGHGDRFRFVVQNVQLTTTRRVEKTSRTVSLTIQVEGPPGSDISGAQTQAVIDEAVDDRGWSMIKPDTQGGSYYLASEDSEDPNAIEFDRHMMMAGRKGGTLGVQVEPPSKEAKGIELIRGRAVLTFPMRRIEGKVLVADLTEGREFPIGPMKIRVKSFERKGGTVTLEISTKGGSSQYGSPFPQFGLVDGDGKSVSRGMSGSGGGDGTYKCVYTVAEEADVAAIQYQASVGRVTKVVRFEIRNIPLPVKE
jgi:hypothetical protein